SDVYPSPDGPLPKDAVPNVYDKYIKEDAFICTGPYIIKDFRQDQSMLMVAYKNIWGDGPSNEKVLTRFFAKASQLLVALKSGEVDVAHRHLTPAQHKSLANADGINDIKGEGAAIRYIVFNPRIKPMGNAKIRRAIAAAVDRGRIIDDVLGGNANPLYSMV